MLLHKWFEPIEPQQCSFKMVLHSCEWLMQISSRLTHHSTNAKVLCKWTNTVRNLGGIFQSSSFLCRWQIRLDRLKLITFLKNLKDSSTIWFLSQWYSVSHIITYPSKELCSKMALGEVGVSLSWWSHALVLSPPGYSGLFSNLIIFS